LLPEALNSWSNYLLKEGKKRKGFSPEGRRVTKASRRRKPERPLSAKEPPLSPPYIPEEKEETETPPGKGENSFLPSGRGILLR